MAARDRVSIVLRQAQGNPPIYTQKRPAPNAKLTHTLLVTHVDTRVPRIRSCVVRLGQSRRIGTYIAKRAFHKSAQVAEFGLEIFWPSMDKKAPLRGTYNL